MGAGKHHRGRKQGEAEEGILKPGKAGGKWFSKYCLGPAVLLDGFVSVFMEKLDNAWVVDVPVGPGWGGPAVTLGGPSPGRILLSSQNSAVCPWSGSGALLDREELPAQAGSGVLHIPRAGMRLLMSFWCFMFFPKKAPRCSREPLADFITRGRRVKYLMRWFK